jgi:hypothetical protein
MRPHKEAQANRMKAGKRFSLKKKQKTFVSAFLPTKQYDLAAIHSKY